MKVQITIRGRSYTVRSDEADEDLPGIARYVDAKMAEIGWPRQQTAPSPFSCSRGGV